MIDVSIHAPPEGRDRMRARCTTTATVFQSTRPRRGAIRTQYIGRLTVNGVVSIHAPPEGRDRSLAGHTVISHGFQSTRPRRGAISLPTFPYAHSACFNPRAPGGARCGLSAGLLEIINVSIHAPPEGRDVIPAECFYRAVCVSIHAPPEGRDATIASSFMPRL